MKLFALLGALLAVAAVDPDQEEYKTCGSCLDDLMQKSLELIREHMISQDPLPIPDIQPWTINNTQFDSFMTLSMRNASISKASSFIVNKLRNNCTSMRSEFNIAFPPLHFEGTFDVSGSYVGCKVSGPVTVKIDWDYAQFNAVFDFGFKSDETLVCWGSSGSNRSSYFKVTESGLKVNNMTEEEVQFWFRDQVRYFNRSTNPVYILINWLVSGKTVSDIISDLQRFIAAGGR